MRPDAAKRIVQNRSRALRSARANYTLIFSVVFAIVVIGAAVALFVVGAHKPTPSPSKSPSPSAAPQRRRGELEPEQMAAFAQTVQNAEDAMATNDAIEFAMEIASRSRSSR
jgi:hypothetical protein